MTTYPQRIHVHRPHVNLWLVAVIGLAAALVGLGAWVLVDRNTSGGGAAVARLMGNTFVGAQTISKHAAVASSFGGFRIARIAPVSVSGDLATTLAEYRTGESASLGKLLTVYQFRDGKILREWSFKLGTTTPFGNAVVP